MLHDAREHFRGTSLMVRPLILGLLVGLATLTLGCPDTYEPDERSTTDRDRTAAREVPLRRPVTDAVNYEGGDATDWKSFEAPGTGPMTIEVYFDNSFIRADVTLYDSYGSQLATQSRSSGTEPIRLVHTMPGEGIFFVRIRSTENHSVYSIRIFPGTGETEGEQVVDPRPEFARPIE